MALPFFTHPIDYRGKACTFRERAFSFVTGSCSYFYTPTNRAFPHMAKSKDFALKARSNKGPMVALYRYLRSLRLEGLPLFQSTLKGRLHFHLTELPDSEIEMLQRLGLFVRIVRKEQLGKLKPGEGDLGAESQAGWPCPSPPDSRPRLRQVCRRTGASGSSSITIRPISPKKP